MADALQGEMEVGAPRSLGYSVISPPSDTAQPVLAHGKERLGVINQSPTSQSPKGETPLFFIAPPLMRNAVFTAREPRTDARAGRGGGVKTEGAKNDSYKANTRRKRQAAKNNKKGGNKEKKKGNNAKNYKNNNN